MEPVPKLVYDPLPARANSYPNIVQQKVPDLSNSNITRSNTNGTLYRNPLVTEQILNNGNKINLLGNDIQSPTYSLDEIMDIYLHLPKSKEGESDDIAIIDKEDNEIDFSEKTSSEIQSPVPIISFSPLDRESSLRNIRREMAIEELISSETTYVNSLRLLLNFYIFPLISVKECSQTLNLIMGYIEMLYKSHRHLLGIMRTMGSEATPRSSQLATCVVLSNVVLEYGMSTHSYVEYIILYEDILKLMNDPILSEAQRQIIRGSESYLEATQPITTRMDLSFLSLLQRPVSRLSKYRLMLESLLKYTSMIDSNYHNISKMSTLIRERLEDINRMSNERRMKDTVDSLNRIINSKIPIQFFGKCLLAGSLLCVWVESESIRAETCGAFCFKSHIILAALAKNKLHGKVHFIIPLVACQIIIQYIEMIDFGGLTTEYPYSLKLLFESNYGKYEIMLISISDQENKVWEEYLETYISLNGPSKMNYRFSRDCNISPIVMQIPDLIRPYDVNISKVSSQRLVQCYFSELMRIGVIRFGDNHFIESNNVELKANHRLQNEAILSKVWSIEVPKMRDSPSKAFKEKSKTSTWSIWSTKDTYSKIDIDSTEKKDNSYDDSSIQHGPIQEFEPKRNIRTRSFTFLNLFHK